MEPASLISQSLVATVATTPPVTVAPDALALERFNAIMQAANPMQPAPLDGVSAPAGMTPSSLGSTILDNLQQVSNDLGSRWQGMAERLDASVSNPSVVDMLRVQADLAQSAVQYELVGKAVAKTTQNIDTLVRIQ